MTVNLVIDKMGLKHLKDSTVVPGELAGIPEFRVSLGGAAVFSSVSDVLFPSLRTRLVHARFTG